MQMCHSSGLELKVLSNKNRNSSLYSIQSSVYVFKHRQIDVAVVVEYSQLAKQWCKFTEYYLINFFIDANTIIEVERA